MVSIVSRRQERNYKYQHDSQSATYCVFLSVFYAFSVNFFLRNGPCTRNDKGADAFFKNRLDFGPDRCVKGNVRFESFAGKLIFIRSRRIHGNSALTCASHRAKSTCTRSFCNARCFGCPRSRRCSTTRDSPYCIS